MKRLTSVLLVLGLSLLQAVGDEKFSDGQQKDAESRLQLQTQKTTGQKASPTPKVVTAPRETAAPAQVLHRSIPQRSAASSGWLIMVYMAADNNLDPYALEDVIEMQKIGSSENLKITVLMDRVDDADWTEARRFLVRRPEDQGGAPSWDLSLRTCEPAGELNMRDPKTLSDFVKWSLETHPEPNTMLVLWNHGGGGHSAEGASLTGKIQPLRAARKMSSRASARGDTNGGNFLEIREVRAALEPFSPLTVIGADAGLMGMMEVAYELRERGSFFIGSQDLEPGEGWPYDRWLQSIATNPDIDPETLCRKIISDYTASYGAKPVTLSAVRLAAMPALAKTLNTLAGTVVDYLEDPDANVDFQGLPWFPPKAPKFVDLGALLKRFQDLLPATVAIPAAAAEKALQAALVVNESSPSLGGTGLSIYPGGEANGIDYRSGTTQFTRDTLWDEMLREMAYHRQRDDRAALQAGVSGRWAVLIGVAEYADPAVPSLRYSVKNVEVLREALINGAGYQKENILVLTNAAATAESVRSTLGTWLPQVVTENDLVLIYFSGCGGVEPSMRGNIEDGTEKYLMLSNSRLDNPYGTALPMSELSRIFNRIRARKLLFVLDSCYAGAAGGKESLRDGAKPVGLSDDYLNALTISSGTAVLTASRASESSIGSPELGMGIFAYYLCDALRGNGDSDGDGLVSVMELYQHVNRLVPIEAKKLGGLQHPVFMGEISKAFPIALVDTKAKKEGP